VPVPLPCTECGLPIGERENVTWITSDADGIERVYHERCEPHAPRESDGGFE
jgi:hypothetical protein